MLVPSNFDRNWSACVCGTANRAFGALWAGTIRMLQNFSFISTGKRECLGEPLAKMELFMFFANILQNFEIQAVEDYRPSLEKFTVSIVRSPHPYTVSFVARFWTATVLEIITRLHLSHLSVSLWCRLLYLTPYVTSCKLCVSFLRSSGQ